MFNPEEEVLHLLSSYLVMQLHACCFLQGGVTRACEDHPKTCASDQLLSIPCLLKQKVSLSLHC